MSKGVLFTVGLVLLSISVLAFASTITAQYEKKRGEESQLLSIDRVSSVFRGIENDFAGLFGTSGIGVDANGTMVSFTEDLPNGRSGTFSTNVDRYKLFFDGNGIRISSAEMKARLPVLVEPSGAVYSHEPFGGGTVKFSSPSPPSAYDLRILLGSKGVQGTSWSPLVTGSLPVHIAVIGQQSADEKRLISASALSVLNITLKAGGGTISIRFDSGNLTLTSYATSTVNVQTNVTAPGSYALGLPDAAEVWLPESGVSRNGTARVK